MSLQSKREYLGQIRFRYRRAGRAHKSKILDEYCQVCGYDRKSLQERMNTESPFGDHSYRPDGARWLPISDELFHAFIDWSVVAGDRS